MAVKTERPAQRRRTRKAIVDATMALLARGHTPSVNDVAAAADVSRRTIYLYFPTFEQLLLDATVGALSQTLVDRALRPAADDHDENGEEDAEARIERLVRALHHISPDVERLGRALIRLTVDRSLSTEAREHIAPLRGYRRIEWIEATLAPWRTRLGPKRWRRLVAALATVIGWEALIVQRDVCGMTAAEGEELSVWTARALVRDALREVAHRASKRR